MNLEITQPVWIQTNRTKRGGGGGEPKSGDTMIDIIFSEEMTRRICNILPNPWCFNFFHKFWFLSCSFIHDSSDHAMVIKRLCHGKNPPQNIFLGGEKIILAIHFIYTRQIQKKHRKTQKTVACWKTQNMMYETTDVLLIKTSQGYAFGPW